MKGRGGRLTTLILHHFLPITTKTATDTHSRLKLTFCYAKLIGSLTSLCLEHARQFVLQPRYPDLGQTSCTTAMGSRKRG
jgi:hypothetical protein